jgi:hypothetical protein
MTCAIIFVVLFPLLLIIGFGVVLAETIIAKTARVAWAKTLADFTERRLKSTLDGLERELVSVRRGLLGSNSKRKKQIMSEIGEIELRMKLVNKLIKERSTKNNEQKRGF